MHLRRRAGPRPAGGVRGLSSRAGPAGSQQHRCLRPSLSLASMWPDTLGDARVQMGNVHELLRAAVEHGSLDELEVELRAVLEQPRIAGLAGDRREDHDFEKVEDHHAR